MPRIYDRSHSLVSLEEFQDSGLPINIGPMGLKCPLDEQYILRMAIRADGGDFILPAELDWLKQMLDYARVGQRFMRVDHPFCYVTVRHGVVKSQTDDQWHVDGFSTKVPHIPEQNYVWSSSDGTEYVPLDVEFPADFDPLKHNVNSYLEQFVDQERVLKCADKTVYCFDPYILHRRPPSTGGTMRTFVRISFVPIEINDVNNTQNPYLPREYSADGVQTRNKLLTYS